VNSLPVFFLGCPIWITQHIVSQNWKSSPKSAKIGLSKFQTYLNTVLLVPKWSILSPKSVFGPRWREPPPAPWRWKNEAISALPMYIRQRRMRDAGELVAYGCLTWCVKMDGVQTDMLVTGFFFMFFGRSWNRSVFFFQVGRVEDSTSLVLTDGEDLSAAFHLGSEPSSKSLGDSWSSKNEVQG